ncbi:MAG: 4-hydroxy-tetrahydrodipicolinate reductase [Kiritimatiellae bacterium]|nr:4-hydroxy-tetrahydrodipicolinate reductase [Kiritimatiellia bacterium]
MKIAILGAAGRMGQFLLSTAAKTEGCEVVAAVERPDHPLLGAAVAVPGVPAGLTYSSQWPAGAEVVIDFTFHSCVPNNLSNAAANGQGYVLGTTGLTPEEQEAVHAAAKAIPVIWAPNMSLGVNLLLELVRRSAEILGPEYDIEIVETHHRLKKDAPSGTAIGLAQAAASGRKVSLDDVACYGRQGIVGERPYGEIGIHALRGGSVVGDHTVHFIADEERIEITHKASSREVFAKGAIRGALWVGGKQPGIYTMRHVLGFE